jgi:hypothetical protein
MDPELLNRLMGIFNPISSAQAQMLGPTVTPTFGSPPPAPDLTPPPPATPASPVPGVPTPSNPMQGPAPPQEAYRSELAPTVGSVLDPKPAVAVPGSVPLPAPRPAGAPGPTDVTDASAATKKPGTDALLKSLQGVQIPKPPEAQKITTPHPPALRPIQSNLADLFASLGISPQQAAGGLKLPASLGAALGGR